MEVKIYEQEWRNGKCIYRDKIHTVIGEEHVSNLMLNTRKLSYRNGVEP